MDALLARLGYQAVNYAMRCGIAVTSTFAVQQCSRLLKTVDDKALRRELRTLQKRLNERVKIISPTLDLIEFKSGRGNIFLENAVSLAKSLHQDIAALGKRLENAAAAEEASRDAAHATRTREEHYAELKSIAVNIQELLARIERDTPFLALAINVSGESLSRSMPPGISPSRFLQGSAFITWGDTQYCLDQSRPVQIGPSFTLSLYMLFLGHSSGVQGQPNGDGQTSVTHNSTNSEEDEPYGFGEGERRPIWQEVLHKCRVRIVRTPCEATFDRQHGYVPKTESTQSKGPRPLVGRPDEFAYHLEIVENLDDGRVHDDKNAGYHAFDGMMMAGIRESIPMHQLSKIFYTDTGRILNIGNDDFQNNAVLLLKREPEAKPPRKGSQPIFSDSNADADGDSLLVNGTNGHDVPCSDDQTDIDRQLLEESGLVTNSPAKVDKATDAPGQAWQLPGHLDPEWLAFEVFENDDGFGDTSDEGDEDEIQFSDDEDEAEPRQDIISPVGSPVGRPKSKANRTTLDSRIISQIRNISIRSSLDARPEEDRRASSSLAVDTLEATESSERAFASSSPFGAITSSLSLMEMLVRLTILQEAQQISHLAMPDHMLTFFLEETSTTGAVGEEKWRMRSRAKRKVGFDPYSDTPSKPTG